jgi:succinate dehydrogenase / fumarate reductase membrane anchor subunit
MGRQRRRTRRRVDRGGSTVVRRAATALRGWLVQRVSAVFMLLFLLFVVGHFLFDRPHSYLDWREWVLSPAVSIAMTVFFVALIAHTWIGLRDVVIDYVHPVAVRVLLLALLGLWLIGLGAWVIRIFLRPHG